MPAIDLRREEFKDGRLLLKMPPRRCEPRRRVIARLVRRPLESALDPHAVQVLTDFNAQIFRGIRCATKQRLAHLLPHRLGQPAERDADFAGKPRRIESGRSITRRTRQ